MKDAPFDEQKKEALHCLLAAHRGAIYFYSLGEIEPHVSRDLEDLLKEITEDMEAKNLSAPIRERLLLCLCGIEVELKKTYDHAKQYAQSSRCINLIHYVQSSRCINLIHEAILDIAIMSHE